MNSACLEMLTHIRGDNASESVRRLTALNVIITRRGRYGNGCRLISILKTGEKHRANQQYPSESDKKAQKQKIQPTFRTLKIKIRYLAK